MELFCRTLQEKLLGQKSSKLEEMKYASTMRETNLNKFMNKKTMQH